MAGMVPPIFGERDGLLAYLAQERYVLGVAAYGLTDAQARAVPSASVLSVGGLIKHVAAVERGWIGIVQQRSDAGSMGDYEAAVAEIADLSQAVPVPPGVPWFPDDVEAWSVRWVLLHLISETARHAVAPALEGTGPFARGVSSNPHRGAAGGWGAS